MQAAIKSIDANVLAAVRWMTVALFCFTGIAITGRGATSGLSTMDIMFYRSWLGVSILAIACYAGGGSVVELRTRQLPLIGFRSVVHFIAQYGWLSALALIPLAELFAIEFTAPLWTALLAPLVLGERLTGVRLAAASLGFIGILLVVRPDSLELSAGTLYAFVAAFGFAFHYLVTKYLTRGDGPFLLVFYTHLIQAVMATAFVLVAGLKVPDPVTACWVVGLTVLGLFAHYSLARAFSLADAIIVAPMDFLRLPLAVTVGIVLYGEAVHPMLALGAAVIVLGNFLNIGGERRTRLVMPAPAREQGQGG